MTEKPIYPRSTCCISGCPKWSRKYPGEWICGRHWRMIRRSRRKALRAISRLIEASSRGRSRRALWEREGEIWEASKREATMRAAGL